MIADKVLMISSLLLAMSLVGVKGKTNGKTKGESADETDLPAGEPGSRPGGRR